MNSPSLPRCPECGKPVPAESQHQVCPACLLAQAMASRTAFDPAAPAPNAPGRLPTANPPPPPPSPEQIADKFPQFEILQCLGRGGMGVVYKARQKSLNRLVAIKILAPEREHDARFAERFAREAELLAKLGHPHIVTIHDFGETSGLFYIVMEFVDGVNLRDLIRDGKLEAKQALAIVPPICEALQYAHDHGIVHRDIKPENLLLDREGRVKIADFGIAALVGSGSATGDGAGECVGTPPYMAPEQGGAISGGPAAAIDHRADIYALGVVLYEMLTGERPARDDVVAPSRKVQIDVRLDEIVLRALEKSPALRYQTAGEFRTRVETVAGARNEAHGGPVAPRISRTVRVGAILALLGLGLAVLPAVNKELALDGAVFAGLLALLAATWGATSQIRSSNGNRRGLRLAVLGTFATLAFVGLLVFYRYSIVARSTADLRAQAETTLQRNRAALDGEAPATMEPILDAWRRGDEVLALNRFLEIDWNAPRPVFATNTLLGFGEDRFAALPESERISAGQELIARIEELQRLFAYVEEAGTSAVATRDFPLARRYFEALRRCGRAVDQKGALLLLRMAAQAIEKKAVVQLAGLPASAVAAPATSDTDKVVVEDLALRLLAAIRDKEDDELGRMSVDRIKGWREALPNFALEMRERFQQMRGRPFNLLPTDSLIQDDFAVVKCDDPRQADQIYIVLFFVKTDEGWKNWMLRNAPPTKPLADFLNERPPATHATREASGVFREYAVNKTFAELAKAAGDPRTPEEIQASVAMNEGDAADLLRLFTLDLPILPNGSVTIAQTEKGKADTRDTEVLRTVIYRDDLAAVIFRQAGKVISVVHGRRDGRWKLFVDASSQLADTATEAEAVANFQAKAPEFYQALQKLPAQPPSALAEAGKELGAAMKEMMGAVTQEPAKGAGVAVGDGFARGFIREPGAFRIDAGGSEIAVKRDEGGALSFALTRSAGGSRETLALERFFKGEGWFVYVETPARVWIFDGQKQLDAITPSGRYSAGDLGVRAFCPDAVWDAVPERVRGGLEEGTRGPDAENLPQAEKTVAEAETLSFGDVKWQAWRTLFEVRDGHGLASLPRVRPGFDYGHWGHGRGPEIITHIGDPDWRDYRIEADLLVPGVDPTLNPHALGLDFHGAGIAFHVVDRKESFNEPGTSAYILGFEGEGNWSLAAHYNNYCRQPQGWGNAQGDAERKLASGTDAKLDPVNGNRFRIEVRGERIRIWLDERKLVDVVDEQMSEPVGGRTLDHGGVAFIGGFDAMIRLRSFSITHLNATE